MSSGAPVCTMRPPSMMVMRLPIFSASSRSWLTKTMVFFSLRLQLQQLVLQLGRGSADRAPRTARPSAGSSASVAKARARPTRCCMPPDSSCAYFSAHCVEVDQLAAARRRAALALGLGHAGELEPEADILRDRAPRQQRRTAGTPWRPRCWRSRRSVAGVAGGDVDHACRLSSHQHLAARDRC